MKRYFFIAVIPVLILMLLTHYAFAGDFNQMQKIVASDRAYGDYFGNSVSISPDGNYAVIGAGYEDEDADGNNTLALAGSAYIFIKDDAGNWTQQAKLVAGDRAASDRFGYSVSIASSDKGTFALIGAYYEDEDADGNNTLSSAGSAYVFAKDDAGNWTQQAKLVAGDRAASDHFGCSVSIVSSDNGTFALIGASWEDEDADGNNTLGNAGSAYVFVKDDTGNWTQQAKLVASDRASNDVFGTSVNIASSDNGTFALIGADEEDEDADGNNTLTNPGSAYVFVKDDTGNWTQQAKLVAGDRANNDNFGHYVSMASSNTGTFALIGAFYEDEDADGNNTLTDPGSAYVFSKDDTGNWTQQAKLVASDRANGDRVGISVSMASSNNGIYTLIGADQVNTDADGGNYANHAGSAYIYNWQDKPEISGSNGAISSSTTSTSATITATVNANGAVTTVTVYYGTSAAALNSSVQIGSTSGIGYKTVTGTIPGLASGTKYYYQIVAQNSEDQTNSSVYAYTTQPASANNDSDNNSDRDNDSNDSVAGGSNGNASGNPRPVPTLRIF